MANNSRRLAAIMFTDMAGYTALMQDNEQLAKKKQDRYRSVLQSTHKAFQGEIIQYIGDGALSIFHSAVGAVECAVFIQRDLQKDPAIPLRIGIHLGDIVQEDEDIYGNGINLASRIESFSVPGAILVSETVYEQIQNQSHLPCRPVGQFHFKHVNRASRLFAVVAEGLVFPDASELEGKGVQVGRIIHNLPAQLSTFIGREKEMREVEEHLEQSRLLTLTGPGGTGKTRLSLQVVERLTSHFQDGVYWVPLAPISDPALVGLTIGQTLGLVQAPDKSMEEVLTDYLRQREILLLLDNFEQIIAAAPLIQSLLSQCPRLKIVVTSRVVLGIPGEQEYPVAPLQLPKLNGQRSVDHIFSYPSVKLFCQRAQLAFPQFQLNEENALAVADICIRLDGLPLAIELAAARIKLFPPQKLLARLNERLDLLKRQGPGISARHQTLRRTIAWSYDLLPEQERKLFVLLSVFVGGCPFEGGEAVTEAIEDEDLDYYDGIQALIDKSLLYREETLIGEPRYYMLETIRSFARELLESAEYNSRIKTAHAEYFVELGEKIQPHITGPQQRRWLDVLELEQDNLRAAIRWTVESGQAGLACRMGVTFFRLWANRGMTYEGISQMNRLLALPSDEQTQAQRLNLLKGLGVLYLQTSEYPAALPVFQEMMTITMDLVEDRVIADARRYLGFVRITLRDLDEGAALSRQALEFFMRQGNQPELALCHNNLGWRYVLQGRPAEAIPHFDQSFSIFQTRKDSRKLGFALANKSWALLHLGRYQEGLIAIEEAIRLHKENKDQVLILYDLQIYTRIFFQLGNWDKCALLIKELETRGKIPISNWVTAITYMLNAEMKLVEKKIPEAERLANQSQILWKDCSVPFFETENYLLQSEIAWTGGDIQRAVPLVLNAMHLSKNVDCRLRIAEAFEQTGKLFLGRQQSAQALLLIAKASAMREALNTPVPPRNAVHMQQMMDDIASALEPSRFASLSKEGK